MRSVLAISSLVAALASPVGCGGRNNANDAGNDTGDAGPDGGSTLQCERRVLEDQVTNARDLGGHPLAGGRFTACRAILRGGDLTRLSEDGCQEFSGLGIKTVIDLRMESTQQNEPPKACVQENATVRPAPMPKLLPDTADNYLALLDEGQAVAALFAALGDANAYPAYIHCVIGRDRASMVTALVLLALGASRETVIAEFLLSEDAGVAVKQECIEALLDQIDSLGGIEAYLSSVGVSHAQLEALRQRTISGFL